MKRSTYAWVYEDADSEARDQAECSVAGLQDWLLRRLTKAQAQDFLDVAQATVDKAALFVQISRQPQSHACGCGNERCSRI